MSATWALTVHPLIAPFVLKGPVSKFPFVNGAGVAVGVALGVGVGVGVAVTALKLTLIGVPAVPEAFGPV